MCLCPKNVGTLIMVQISNKNMVTLTVTRWEEKVTLALKTVVTRSINTRDVPKSQNFPPKLM